MKKLLWLLMTAGIGIVAFLLGQNSGSPGPNSAIETDKEGTFIINALGGRSNSMEYITDYNSDGITDRWSLTAWENHPEKPSMTLAITDRNGDGHDDGYAVLVEYGEVGFGAARTYPVEGNESLAGFSAWYQDGDTSISSRYYDFNLDGVFDRLEQSGASKVFIEGCWREVIESTHPYQAVVDTNDAHQEFIFDGSGWIKAKVRPAGNAN